MTPKSSVATTGVLMVVSALAGAAGTYIFFETSIPDQFLDAIPIAEALHAAEDAVWPPAPDAPVDVAADAGALPRDAGPALPPVPAPRRDLKVRHGQVLGLHYIEAIYGEAPFDAPLPVVLVLHGRGGRALVPGGPFYGLTHPIRVIAPQAPDRLGSGWEWLPVRVGSGLVDRLSASLVSTASRLARFVRAFEARQVIEGKPVVTGFSQGGLVTLGLALYHDDVVGTALPLSAWLPPPLEPAYRRSDIRYPAIRAMHGTIDEVIPIDPTRELFARLSDQHFEVELVEFDSVAHETSAAMNTLFHYWLEAAICRTMNDPVCEFTAEQQAREAQGLEPFDAGVPADLDGSVDAAVDAGAVGLDAFSDGHVLDGSLEVDADGALDADATMELDIEAEAEREDAGTSPQTRPAIQAEPTPS